MFKELNFDDTASLAALIAFVITSGAFIAIVWRTLRMKRKKVEHLANLPLEEDPPKPTEKDSS